MESPESSAVHRARVCSEWSEPSSPGPASVRGAGVLRPGFQAPPPFAPGESQLGAETLCWGMWQENVGTAPRPRILSVPSWLPGKGCTGGGRWGRWKEHFLLGPVGRVYDFLSLEGNSVPPVGSLGAGRSHLLSSLGCGVGLVFVGSWGGLRGTVQESGQHLKWRGLWHSAQPCHLLLGLLWRPEPYRRTEKPAGPFPTVAQMRGPRPALTQSQGLRPWSCSGQVQGKVAWRWRSLWEAGAKLWGCVGGCVRRSWRTGVRVQRVSSPCEIE